MAKQSTSFTTREDALSERQWKLVDAEGRALGRVATQVAGLLRGKGKPTFAPHTDCGDFVIVLNASKIRLTGNKASDKILYRHTGFAGGIRGTSAGKMREEKPEKLLRDAVAGMLPRNRLARRLITKLKVYPAGDHPHEAQSAELVPAQD
jgi:large subunit ribosomal protein L13